MIDIELLSIVKILNEFKNILWELDLTYTFCQCNRKYIRWNTEVADPCERVLLKVLVILHQVPEYSLIEIPQNPLSDLYDHNEH